MKKLLFAIESHKYQGNSMAQEMADEFHRDYKDFFEIKLTSNARNALAWIKENGLPDFAIISAGLIYGEEEGGPLGGSITDPHEIDCGARLVKYLRELEKNGDKKMAGFAYLASFSPAFSIPAPEELADNGVVLQMPFESSKLGKWAERCFPELPPVKRPW